MVTKAKAPPKAKAKAKVKAPAKAKPAPIRVTPTRVKKAPAKAEPLKDVTPGKNRIKPKKLKAKKVDGKRIRPRSILKPPAVKKGMPVIGVGRNGVYHELYPELVRRFGRLAKGLSNVEMASLFEVAETTIEKWISKYDEFKMAVYEAREITDSRVERALFERAVGYSHREDKVFYNARTGQTIVTTGTKHYPPETGAIEFYLTNRLPEKWKKRVEYKAPTTGRRLVIMEVGPEDDIPEGGEVISEQ